MRTLLVATALLLSLTARAATPTFSSFDPTQFTTNGSPTIIHVRNSGSNEVVFAYPVGIPPFLSYWLDTNHLSESSLQVVDPTTVRFISLLGQTLDVTGTGTNEFNNGQFTNFLWSVGPFYAGSSTDLIVSATSGYTGAGTSVLADDGTYKPIASLAISGVWTNSAGVIKPTYGQTTNVLEFTSGLSDNPTNTAALIDSATAWTGGSLLTVANGGGTLLAVTPSTVNVTANVLSLLSTGPTNYFDLNFATQTNLVTVALAFSFATNGVAGYSGTVLREFLNTSGGDLAVTWPTISAGTDGWRTNAAAPLPPAFTNGTWTKVLVEITGPTDTQARQTNCHVIGVTYN